jgi:hypothetical protein
VLFKKLFRLLVVGGAVAAAQTSCATGSSAKTADGTATAGSTDKSADGGTTEAASDKGSSQSSGGGGVMGW